MQCTQMVEKDGLVSLSIEEVLVLLVDLDEDRYLLQTFNLRLIKHNVKEETPV